MLVFILVGSSGVLEDSRPIFDSPQPFLELRADHIAFNMAYTGIGKIWTPSTPGKFSILLAVKPPWMAIPTDSCYSRTAEFLGSRAKPRSSSENASLFSRLNIG